MLPTRGQVYGLFLQILDDPAARVFTDVPNASTGALSVFQAGFSQAFDLLFNNALGQQVSQVEEVVNGIIVPQNPGPFSMTPADMGLPDFADWEWISERTAGSNDKFIDLFVEDRLTQRAPTEQLLETVYQNGAFQFVGCTSVRELEIKFVSSGIAPINNNTVIPFDGSLNFLANYSAKIGKNKGRKEIAEDAMLFAVGAKFDSHGIIGGELFRLMQPLVRSRQDVPVAHKPFTTQRRLGVRRGIPYVSAQQGTTGGGSQNVPIEYSSTQGTIIGTIDGINLVFYLAAGQVMRMTLYRNGVAQTPSIDYTSVNNMITFATASVPLPGDYLTAEAWLGYGIPS